MSSQRERRYEVGDRVFVRHGTAFTPEGAAGEVVAIDRHGIRPLRVQLDPPAESPFDLMDLRYEDVVPDLMAALEASLKEATDG